jgi:hypothetical protein
MRRARTAVRPTATGRARVAVDTDRDDIAGDAPPRLIGRTLGDDAAVIDDREAIAQRIGFVEVVRGEEDRGAVVTQAPHLVPHVEAALRIQTVVGSSRNTSAGWCTSPIAMSSRRFGHPTMSTSDGRPAPRANRSSSSAAGTSVRLRRRTRVWCTSSLRPLSIGSVPPVWAT